MTEHHFDADDGYVKNFSLSWAEAEEQFPGCTPQWDAQDCQAGSNGGSDVVLFVNGKDELTAAWIAEKPGVNFGTPHMNRLTIYAWWNATSKRWTSV